MKRSREEVKVRRETILSILEKTGSIQVAEMAKHLKVSLITLRRDLQVLEDEGHLQRYYGGASIDMDSAIREKKKTLLQICRENIARLAADMVEEEDTLFINTSSTALLMLKYIRARNVTVITNNSNVVSMQRSRHVKVVLTGGELYNVKGALVGEFAKQSIERVSAKKTFVGCSGLSLKNGMTTEVLSEVDLNRAMVTRCTGRACIMADHTKLGKNSSFISCPIDLISHVITDDLAPEELLSEMRDRGIRVYQASSREIEQTKEV